MNASGRPGPEVQREAVGQNEVRPKSGIWRGEEMRLLTEVGVSQVK